MKFQVISEQTDYSLRELCSALAVSVSGYHAWRRRGPSQTELARRALTERIRTVYEVSRGCYGSPRIHAELQRQGLHCSRGRVERLMRSLGLRARQRQRYVTTTESSGNASVSANLLSRRFTPAGIKAWAADLTALRTADGLLYLAVVLDIPSRRVLGWSMDSKPGGQLALDALQMAIGRSRPSQGQLHHSDRGGHYTSTGYQSLLEQHGMIASMSRRGDCYDNAVVESFFATLKRELLYPQSPQQSRTVRQQVFEYIEVFYNRQRLHSSLGYRSPETYAKLCCTP